MKLKDKLTAGTLGNQFDFLGIDATQAPSASNHPTTFGRQAKAVWLYVVEGPTFQDYLTTYTNTNELWFRTIYLWLEECAKEGIWPFASNVKNDDKYLVFMTAERERLARFLNAASWTKYVTVRRADTRFNFGSRSFTITAKALLDAQLDPTLPQALKEEGFTKLTDTLWQNNLHSHVTINVSLSPSDPYLQYSIVCPTALPGNSEAMSDHNWALKNWAQIVRNVKFTFTHWSF
jgi:hypothetical protein